MISTIFFLIADIIIVIIGIIIVINFKTKINKSKREYKEQEKYNEDLIQNSQTISETITNLIQNKQNLCRQNDELNIKIHYIKDQIEQYNKILEEKKENEVLLEESLQAQYKNKVSVLDEAYSEFLININNQKQRYEQEKQEIVEEVEKLRNSLNAAINQSLKDKETEEQLDFYKLHVTDSDLFDIEMLNKVKPMINKPIILDKLIWSTFFQRQTTELCNKVFGNKTITGIYKITNLLTKQIYIGQSVNIQERIKQHIKKGLGIDAPANNTLYNSMKKDGIWNFTFELVEQCAGSELNEKEKFFIQLYQSDKYGMNSTGGNNK